MPIRYLQIPVDDYGSFIVEITQTESQEGLKTLGVDEKLLTQEDDGFEDLGVVEDIETLIAEANNGFDQMSSVIKTISYGFRDHIVDLGKQAVKIGKASRPDEATIEFGLTFKSDAGVVVAKAGVDADFKVTLTWKATEG